MARTLTTATEIIAPEGHPKFPDTVNRYMKEIDADWLEEHTESGTQIDKYEYWGLLEADEYTGTGATLTVSYTATVFTATVLLLLWGTDDGELYFCTTAGQTKKASNGSVITDGVTAFDEEGFTLGTNVNLNTNTHTYYYCVLAMGTTPDAGSNASPPTWIADGAALLGGIASTNANSVADNLDTKFLTEHTIDTGAHDDSVFDDLAKVYTGTFTVTGAVDQEIELTNGDLDIRALWLWDASTFLRFKSEALATLRDYTATALTGVNFITVGTGSFVINGTLMNPTATTILDINSDTTDGDYVIEDSSAVPLTIYNGGGGYSAVAHSTDQAHSGATSLKFPAGTTLASFYAASDHDLLGNFDVNFELFLPSSAVIGNAWFCFLQASGIGGSDGIILFQFVDTAGAYTIKVTIVDDDGGTTYLNSTTDLADATWHNISLSRTSGFLNLQIDTISEDSTSLPAGISGIVRIYFAKTVGGGTTTAWYMDDIQVDVQLPLFATGETLRYVAIGED